MMIPAYPEWLNADALKVAPRLLGCELISTTADGEAGGRIVEVEVYHGATDPASHAYRGKTPRTMPMFEAGGTIYVYLSYGMHRCLNLVTGPAGEAQAILIRALEPTLGLELMRARRGPIKVTDLTNGPGKLAQALGITLDISGSQLGQALQLIESPKLSSNMINISPRIGIKQAIDYPYRFSIQGSPFVSRT